ncbi:hypothetical protein SLEP1_g53651 [Rubroshorea leprosula]|uniref:Uncharacterized protein n=1 Tax=Rubroshorea leprosula TaxID=152421 RepID=A0AAV5M9Y0_9ROSI|nr:hypothetical protein SLEP1_g53651 [Rubroshorea leprosula]
MKIQFDLFGLPHSFLVPLQETEQVWEAFAALISSFP